ncbi:MAG: FUSC family protein [Actinomycetota bacterium]|nr:FUSC family protein [Actinomycetota bacterium]
MSDWSSTWTRPIQDAIRLDRSKLALVPAARCALGIAIPLVAGDLSGHLLVGVGAAVGALTAGMASLQGTYRSRVKIMAFAAAAFATSAFVGATVGRLEGPDIALTALWGVLAGLLVMFGEAPGVVGLQAVIGLVVFSQFSFSPEQAALNALWALCGGTIQIVLVAVTWPLQRFPVERAMSSDAYRLLAAHLRSLASDPADLLDPGVLDKLRSALVETQPWGDRTAAAAYQALADEAERIRLEVAGIARARARLAHASRVATPTEKTRALDAASHLEDAITASADLLAGVAAALRDGRSAIADPEARERYRAAIEHLRSMAEIAEPSIRPILTSAVVGLTALAGQLRSVTQLTAVAAGDQPGAPPATASSAGQPVRSRSRLSPLAGTAGGRLELVRANLTGTSEVFRHALRVGATLAVAVAISHLFPLGHGYWLPMTVMIVLKPDFATTLSRGVGRSLGTLLGAGMVTLLLATLAPSPAVLIVLTVALYAASVAVLRANYVIYSIGIASLVVVLLGFTGSPAASLAADRAFYTLLGAALALAAYAAWPTWERTHVVDRLADLVDIDGRYGAALLFAWADPAGVDREALQRLRLAAGLARSNAEASVDRWLSEPAARKPASPNTLDAETAQGILAAVRRYVWSALVLHGQLPGTGPVRPELHRLGEEVEEAMAAVVVALRTGSAPTRYPPLRSTQVALAAHLRGASAQTTTDPTLAAADTVLMSETDLMVNAVDTLAHLVGVGPRSPAGSSR